MQNNLKIFNILRLQAAITLQWLQITRKLPNNLLRISSFHLYHCNQFKVIPLACTLCTRNLPKFFTMSDAAWQHGR